MISSISFPHSKFSYLCAMKFQTTAYRGEKTRAVDPLPVMEQFYTLQGEGAWTGEPTYFVRLAGCDVGCHWCDVKESWGIDTNQYMTCDDIVVNAVASGTRRVVITGGEPTMHDLTLFTEKLHLADLKIHMETAGPHPLTGKIDWITLSPKKFLPPVEEYYHQSHELKVVIYNQSDFKWAEEHAERCHDGILLFLQPEWSRRDKMTPLIIDYIKAHPKWRLSQQTHKYLGIE